MTRNIIFKAIVIGVLLLGSNAAYAADKPSPTPDSTSEFKILMERLFKGDTTLDFRQLRLAYTKTPLYDPYGLDSTTSLTNLRAAMFRLAKEEKFGEAYDSAFHLAMRCFVDLDAQLMLAYTAKRLDRKDQLKFYGYVVVKLIRSILTSGDGKSKKTAYQVISLEEERAFLQQMGFKIEKQSLIRDGDRAWDMIEAIKADSKEKQTIYFDVSIPMSTISARFGNEYLDSLERAAEPGR